MGGRVTVVLGPARSGKTERLLTGYRGGLESAADAPGSVLWFAPTQRSAADIRDRLLAGSLAACFDPGVTTFARFAERVVLAAGQQMRPVSPLMKRQLIRRLIDEQLAAGGLRHFAPIAATDGLVDIVAAWISELKRLEIWPDEFRSRAAESGRRAKDRELADLYAGYQQLLEQHQLYDAEGRIWAARRLLTQRASLFAGLRRVVVDGFTDFTRTQHEILEQLAARCDEVAISLPLDLEPGREALFDKSLGTLEGLRERHADLVEERCAASPDAPWPALRHVERGLFADPRHDRPLAAAERIEIVAASQALGEVQQVGRRIKRLLVDEGVRPGEIALVFRSLSEAAPLVREVFDELGIPFACEERPRLQADPALAALGRLLRLVLDDWPFRGLLAFLRSGFFRPAWPEWRDGAAVDAAEQLIRALQIPGGRLELLGELRHWAETADSETADSKTADSGQKDSGQGSKGTAEGGRAGAAGALSDPDNDDDNAGAWLRERTSLAALAFPLLERFSVCCEALPESASAPQWLAALEELAEETGLLRALDADVPPLAARAARRAPGATSPDRAAWDRFRAALGGDGRLAEWLGEPAPPLSRAELAARVEEILTTEPLPGPLDETGRVRVLTAASARALQLPYLFLAGLAEQAFPPADRDDGPYADIETRSLRDAGLPLDDRIARSRAEMLLFYEAITRADERLVLSYPALDAKAQPLLPSPYLAEVERACGEGVLPRTEQLDLSPLPPVDQPQSPRDLRLLAVSRSADKNLDPLAQLLACETAPGLAAALAAALRTGQARARGDTFGPQEGILQGSAAHDWLAARYGSHYAWSPSRLERYAHCPYQFFLRHVLQIAPLDDLALADDYLERGRLLHDALAETHRRINARFSRTASPAELEAEELLELVDEVLRKQLESRPPRSPLEGALREIDRRTVMRWIADYHRQHAAYDAQWSELDNPPAPAHFEVRFGADRHADADEDPTSTDATFPFETVDGQVVQITGRIDRLDVGRAAGRPVFNILDYKSSATAKGLQEKDVEAGTALQLPLYALATEALGLAGEEARPWRAGYWMVRKNGCTERAALKLAELDGDELRATSKWDMMRTGLRRRVAALVAGVRSGAFPMQSPDENCTSRCDYSTVCRVYQARALEKTWPPPASSEANDAAADEATVDDDVPPGGPR